MYTHQGRMHEQPKAVKECPTLAACVKHLLSNSSVKRFYHIPVCTHMHGFVKCADRPNMVMTISEITEFDNMFYAGGRSFTAFGSPCALTHISCKSMQLINHPPTHAAPMRTTSPQWTLQ